MPIYRDYHRTVVGYHGTLKERAAKIVTGEASLRPSQNDDDWLGHGVYFWEHAPQQAWKWAAQRYSKARKPVAVLGAMIRLGNCFDLLDPSNARTLQRLHRQYLKAVEEASEKPPKNMNARKRLDCATLEFAYAAIEEVDGQSVDTCRAVYVPTQAKDRLWERSWLYADTHLQLCVRNPACILGVWLVRPEEEP